jgi:TolB protein
VTRIAVVLSLLLILSNAAHAQMDVWPDPIVQENVFQIPLWLTPLEPENADLVNRTQRIEQVLYTDLEFSGLFKIIRGTPVAAGMQAKDYSVQVHGRVWLEKDNVYFEGLVTDIASGDFLGGKKYRLRNGREREVAHHFSDEVVRLVTGEQGVASTRIVFVRKGGGQWELVVSDYDGYGPKVLVRQSVPLLNPRWVDRDDAVVYATYRDGKPDLYIRYLAEPKSQPIATYPGINYCVDWSEKRQLLVAALSKDGNSELYTMDKTGHIQHRLTHNRGIDTSPCWAPSGREIVFTSDRSGSPQLYIMEADGSNVRRLTFTGGYNDSPSWGPRGEMIAFVSRLGNEFQIAVISPDGRDGRLVTHDSNSHEDPRWAPDGRHIAYSERSGSDEVISVVDIVTGGKRILAQGENPDWSRR